MKRSCLISNTHLYEVGRLLENKFTNQSRFIDLISLIDILITNDIIYTLPFKNVNKEEPKLVKILKEEGYIKELEISEDEIDEMGKEIIDIILKEFSKYEYNQIVDKHRKVSENRDLKKEFFESFKKELINNRYNTLNDMSQDKEKEIIDLKTLCKNEVENLIYKSSGAYSEVGYDLRDMLYMYVSSVKKIPYYPIQKRVKLCLKFKEILQKNYHKSYFAYCEIYKKNETKLPPFSQIILSCKIEKKEDIINYILEYKRRYRKSIQKCEKLSKEEIMKYVNSKYSEKIDGEKLKMLLDFLQIYLKEQLDKKYGELDPVIWFKVFETIEVLGLNEKLGESINKILEDVSSRNNFVLKIENEIRRIKSYENYLDNLAKVFGIISIDRLNREIKEYYYEF